MLELRTLNLLLNIFSIRMNFPFSIYSSDFSSERTVTFWHTIPNHLDMNRMDFIHVTFGLTLFKIELNCYSLFAQQVIEVNGYLQSGILLAGENRIHIFHIFIRCFGSGINKSRCLFSMISLNFRSLSLTQNEAELMIIIE